MNSKKLYNSIVGAAIGDALGVPVEGVDRETLEITGMTGNRVHQQPLGTWSDDTSMILATLDSLANGFNLQDMANRFLSWGQGDIRYTCHDGEVFDIGVTTRNALKRIAQGIDPLECGGKSLHDNGNGAIMRILPLAFVFAAASEPLSHEDTFKIVSDVSGITHGHVISQLACFMYVETATWLIRGFDLATSFRAAKRNVSPFIPIEFRENEFSRFYGTTFLEIKEEYINNFGFVVSTLEAAIWCNFKGRTFEEVVLKAVNLGEDADTVACIAGGLAGIRFNPPAEWILKLESLNKIKKPIQNFCKYFYGEI